MKLSVGMIMKNEEKYLERCLTALKPILEQIDSELIIADTGSTDNSVEIAKIFTDNVFYFEWINDFAAARNSTLDRAQGEWYMFIDADEIIQDCSDIIRFFNSGEYKKYKNASYIVRSFSDEQNFSIYGDIRSLRLFKKTAQMKFMGEVHETISLFESPTKFLDCIALHYGYLYRRGEELTELAREKAKRNLDILFKMLDEERDPSPNIYNQIADCYAILDDNEKSLEYVNMGFERVSHDRIEIVQYYSHKLNLLIKAEKYNEAIKLCSNYFDTSKNPARRTELASDCYVYMMHAYADYKQRSYKAAVRGLVKFFDTYRKYEKGKLNTLDLVVDVFRIDEAAAKTAYDIFFRCCYQEKMFDLANEYTEAVPIKKFFDDEKFMTNNLNIRFEMMKNVGFGGLDKLYRQLDEKWQKYLLCRLRYGILSVSAQDRALIIRKMSALDEIPSELSKIYSIYFDKNSAAETQITNFLKKYGSENSEDVLYIMLDTQSDITPFLNTEDYFADRAVQLMLMNFPNTVDVIYNYNINVISDEGVMRAVNFYGWVMLRAMERGSKVTAAFEKYAELGEKWAEVNEDLGGEVPGDVRAALLVRNIVTAKRSGNSAAANEAAKKLTDIVPDLILVLDAYEEENPEAFRAPSKRVDPEFAALAVQVKQNIRDLIRAGDAANSRALLKEYEELCPDDPDINGLRNDINNLLQ